MSADEDTELRDLIVRTLEDNGVLGKMKAELRASVFLALEDNGNFKEKIAIANKKLSDFSSTSDGKKALSLVREFLEFFGLQFTLSVFEPEASGTNFLTREELCFEFNIPNAESSGPIISELIKHQRYEHPEFMAKHSFEEKGDITMESDLTTANCKTALENIASDFNQNAHKANNLEKSASVHDPFYDDPVPQAHSTFTGSNSSQFLRNNYDRQLKLADDTFNAISKDQEEKESYTGFVKVRNEAEDNLFLHHLSLKEHSDQSRNHKEESSFLTESKPRELDKITAEKSLFSGEKSELYHQQTFTEENLLSRNIIQQDHIDEAKIHIGNLFSGDSKHKSSLDQLRRPSAENFGMDEPASKEVSGQTKNVEKLIISSESKSRESFDRIKMTDEGQFSGKPISNECLDRKKTYTGEDFHSNDLKQKEYKEVLAFSQKAELIKEQSLTSLRDLPDLNIGSKSMHMKQKKPSTGLFASKLSDDGEESTRSDYSAKSSQRSLGGSHKRYEVDSRENSEQSIEEEIDDISADIDDLLSSISIGDDATSDASISQISQTGGYDHIEQVLPK